MAYRNTIISLVSMVALGTACSKAPNYNSGVQTGVQAADGVQIGTDDVGHGPDVPEVKKDTAANEPAAPVPAAPAAETKPAAPATGTAPAPVALTDAEKAKAMNTKGFIVYAVSAADGAGWNTATTPFIVAPTLDAAGAVDKNKPFAAIFCNYLGAGKAMQLHSSSGQGPTAHGNSIAGADLPAGVTLAQQQVELNKLATTAEVLKNTNCATNTISALGATVGATYNHRGGNANNAASHVFFKMFTVDTAGVVAAK